MTKTVPLSKTSISIPTDLFAWGKLEAEKRGLTFQGLLAVLLWDMRKQQQKKN